MWIYMHQIKCTFVVLIYVEGSYFIYAFCIYLCILVSNTISISDEHMSSSPGLIEVRVIFSFCVVFCKSLFVCPFVLCPFSIGYCIVYPSPIYAFSLLRWQYPQAFFHCCVFRIKRYFLPMCNFGRCTYKPIKIPQAFWSDLSWFRIVPQKFP